MSVSRSSPPGVSRRRLIGWAAATGAAVPLGAAAVVGPAAAADSVTVAADGSGDYTTVQAAVNAAPTGRTAPFTINIEPGTYREVVTVPSNKPFITLHGTGSSSTETVIVYDNAADTPNGSGGTLGTFGSASVFVSGHDFTASNLTVSNDFDEASSSYTNKQAVALRIEADRSVLTYVRVYGNQDTLLANGSARAYFDSCTVQGDVDFIFGSGTAVFSGCQIVSLDRGSSSNNGYVTAASTPVSQAYGYLFYRCALSSSAAAKSVYLGRPWHPSGDPNAEAQVLYRECALGAHIRDDPWTDMSGFSWQDARFDEYQNTGAGATVNSNRPQLADSAAANYTPQKYLAGSDGWDPTT